ncbi:MAG: response regulator [Cyanobacteria bacterium CRU_2_1]|nr:response regulator [Cyanobacteria bacterium CRU_2_1]
MNTTSSQGDRYTVLVIEDNRFTRMQLCSLLEADGYHVASAENGEAGLALYHRLHPDLILLDAMMPEMDGFTCCTQLRQLVGDNLPIVMITCLEDQESVDCAFRVGTTDYITKPINWAVLRQRVWHQIQRSHLYTQVQQLNAELEKKVTERTAQLQQTLNFEATLKRITDRVRDSLDEQQILQAAVKELALALEIDYCGTALSDLKHATSKIFQEYSTLPHLNHSQIVRMVDFPGIYAQLLQGQHFQFCKLPTSQNYLIPDRIAALACPIFDNEGALGELWLFKPMHGTFDEIEVRLVKQVANQCAIAIRQSRLYQAAQTQIEELARLNTLKDDF